MNRRSPVMVAWGLFAACLAGAVISLILNIPGLPAPPSLFNLVEAFGWTLAIPIVFSGVAALIIARQSGNRVGWLMMFIAFGVVSPGSLILRYLPEAPTNLTPGLWLLLWFDGWSWIPAIFPIFLIPLHFPTGQPPSPRWNWVTRLAIGMWLFFIIITSFFKTIGPLEGNWTVLNPIGFIPDTVAEGAFMIVWGIGLLTLLISSVASLFVRYRRAGDRERQQIKWLLYAGTLFAFDYTLTFFLSENEFTVIRGLVDLLFVFSILAIPLAIAVAIFRYRLYDIDLIIRRTLQYAILTGLLALVYFGSVVLLQGLVGNLTGEQSPLVIVLSTLVIAVLFNPLRIRVQDFIDHRFYRKKYSAERALAKFAAKARDEVDMENLSTALLSVVEETMQPEQVSLWLLEKKK
ncbi:MAG TPA: hypothetical protein VE136_00835 [Anaerolineales bacterium]|nr:hypothetical protein [Anaerolineales bacterium]